MSEMEKITGNSPEAKSLDITQQNIEQLRQLFPDVFSENKIDVNALTAQLVESGGELINPEEERYNFTWNGKTKARQIAQTPSTGTLRPSKGESINWNETENLFIEGDNLEVLKLLQKSYHKKVKMIFIDPPYNTGNDFVYKDNFIDNVQNYLEQTNQVDHHGNKLSTNSDTSGRYHSEWLNMMYPRLKLARNLLANNGVVFITIDDKEYANLKQVCDEVFGEGNFVSNIIWQSRTSISDDHEISLNHNSILVYAKNYSTLDFYGNELDPSEYENRDDDPRGPWKLVPLDANKPGGDTMYPIENPKTGELFYPPEGRSWAINRKSFESLFNDNRIAFGVNGDSAPKKKLYLEERIAKGDTKTPSSLLLDAGTTKDGSNEVAVLLGKKKIFSYPKPVKLLKKLIQFGVGPKDNEIVMDFFCGSGTTGQAVMELNKEDNKNNKFILVQLPEDLESSLVAAKGNTKSIIKNSIDYLKTHEKPLFISELTKIRLSLAVSNTDLENLGYKTFKLAKTNIRPWDADFDNLEQVLQQATESIKADRSNEDVLYEILLKYGIELTVQVETEIVNGKEVFVVGAGALIVCLDDGITSEVVEGIAKLKDKLDPETTQVVFKDAGFADSNVKTNAIQILKQAGVDDVKSI
ncbi:site-specific DNA-methyltransferase [Psychrobacter faecalis]|uniref:site-specific DNA-methyltransferase n=1 Tax=Psychrobacter faecalis TaxID=180588 RepID=UPI003FD5B73B